MLSGMIGGIHTQMGHLTMSEDKQHEYEPDDLLTVKQVAELIDRSGARVRQLVKDLDIPHMRMGPTIVVKYKDIQPIFDRNTIRGYTPPESEE